MANESPALPGDWTRVKSPPSLFRRFEFRAYADTRRFLEEMAAVSEETGIYPDLGFGTTYVNVTIASGGAGAADEAALGFAARLNALGGTKP